MAKFHIKVPCSSANLGPGFDVLGLSLSLFLFLDAEISSGPAGNKTPILAYTGEGADEAPLDPFKNLTTRVALYVLRCHGIQSFPVGLSIKVHNEIPFGRGLGSSGAAVIAGVLLADALGDLGLKDERKLDFALMVERHPDNVAAALIGGFVGSYLRELSPEDTSSIQIPLAEVLPEYPEDAGEDWGREPPIPPNGIGHYIRFGWAPEIKAVVIIPKFEVSTAKARGALLPSYKLKDVVSETMNITRGQWEGLKILRFPAVSAQVFNLQRIAVLTTALTRSPPDSGLIFQAMQDRIHQPYRTELVSKPSQCALALHPTTPYD